MLSREEVSLSNQRTKSLRVKLLSKVFGQLVTIYGAPGQRCQSDAFWINMRNWVTISENLGRSVVRKFLILQCAFVLSGSTVHADTFPKSKIAQYIVDHLDVTSFSLSIGPRREKAKVTFGDYGIRPTKIESEAAVLKPADGSWEFDLKILSRTETTALICLRDFAQNGGSYDAQAALMLVWDKSAKTLISDKRKYVSQDCPDFAR
jgi:hypothetical protein